MADGDGEGAPGEVDGEGGADEDEPLDFAQGRAEVAGRECVPAHRAPGEALQLRVLVCFAVSIRTLMVAPLMQGGLVLS